MNRTQIFDSDGKTREERETLFAMPKSQEKHKKQGKITEQV